jgi:hypothetical protein
MPFVEDVVVGREDEVGLLQGMPSSVIRTYAASRAVRDEFFDI